MGLALLVPSNGEPCPAQLDSVIQVIDNPAVLTLATWNVMAPVSVDRQARLAEHMRVVDADVWVLTEAYDGFGIRGMHSHASGPGRDGRHLPAHRWVTIWSRFRLEPLEVSDQQRSAAARIQPLDMDPFIVFGTVLPWLGSAWRDHPARHGAAFRESLALQAMDWARLRTEFPADERFVLGDFNQDLVTPGYCGSRANRSALESALSKSELKALTSGANDPVRRDLPPRACIDHVCGRIASAWQLERTLRLPTTSALDRSLSDHFGVAVCLRRDC